MKEESGSLMQKPQKLWNEALRKVKGEDTLQLMEQFTAEMTLVAEGLCEDQNKLRAEVASAGQEEDRRLQRLDTRLEELNTLTEERERETDRLVTELRIRLAALEKQADQAARAREREAARQTKKERNHIRDLTVLILVAAACVVAVTLVIKLV